MYSEVVEIKDLGNQPIIMFTMELKSAPSCYYYYYYYFLLVLIIIISTSTTTDGKSGNRGSPCKRLVLNFHEIIYNGKNAENATSAIVAAPAGGNKIKLAGQNHFGDLVVFDDPITLDNNLHSAHIGRAQGFYLYDWKDWFTAGFGFTFVFNSTRHYMGTMTFAGADPLNKTRDIYVILIETLRQLRSKQKHL